MHERFASPSVWEDIGQLILPIPIEDELVSFPSPARTRRAKFVPPASSPWMVARPRLVYQLDDARFFPVTLISAAAGSGKTTLLGEWARSLDAPWGWLTVDEGDAPLDLFLTNLITAMQMASPGLGESALSLLRIEANVEIDALVAELDDDLLALDQNLVVVVDDVHTIRDPRSIEFLQRLLQHPSPQLHLVLGARRDPPLPLARLRNRGQLLELRAADLAFTEAETRDLLRNAGVSGDLAESLEQRNEGWAAGIHLGALALRGQPPGGRAVEEIVAAGVHDLIVNDILALQPKPVQQLLLISSLVDRFTGELCAVLFDDGEIPAAGVRPLLQEIAAEGLLLYSLGGEPEWFRYHQIFRDVLRRELNRQISPDALARLHLRCSAWFDGNGMVTEALTHALEAGGESVAADIVERNAQRALADDLWPELARWLDRLPPALVRSSPELLVAQAWVYQSRGMYSDLVSAIDRASVLIDSHGTSLDRLRLDALRDDVHVLRIFLSYVDDDPDAWVTAGEASLSTGGERFASSFGVYELGFGLIYRGDYQRLTHRMQAIVEHERGRDDAFGRQRELWARELLAFRKILEGSLSQAEAELDDVLGLANSYDMARFAAQTRYLLGWLAYERNQVEDAIDWWESVAHDRSTGIVNLVNASSALARAYEATRRQAEAEIVLRRMTDRYREARQASFGKEQILAAEAELALWRGDLTGCERWARTAADAYGGIAVASIESPLLTRARIRIALGQLGLAGSDIRQLEERAAGPPAVVAFQIRIAAVRALHTWVSGDREQATRQMEQALALGAASGYVRSALDVGLGLPPFLDLLRRMPTELLPVSARELTTFYATPSPEPEPASYAGIDLNDMTSPADRLTERERDVMDYLLRRLSYKEIALELGISPLTVKSHSTHIYAKLGVSNRRQMIRLLERPTSA